MIGSFGMDEQGVALTFGAEFFSNPDISSSQEMEEYAQDLADLVVRYFIMPRR